MWAAKFEGENLYKNHICYKLIQMFRVTCFITGQYNTGYYGTFTDVI